MPTASLVFVTALLDLREDRSKDRSTEVRIRHFRTLASSGIPIVLFLSRSFKACDVSAYPNVRIVWLEFEDLPLFKSLAGHTVKMPPRRTVHHDTANFMILMNSKVDLVLKAASLAASLVTATHYAWIDFNITHVVKTGLGPFLNRLQLLAASRLRSPLLLFPGCLDRGPVVFDAVHWRFCGGFFLGDLASLRGLGDMIREHGIPAFLDRGLTWEVNLWAHLEQTHGFAPTWYKADHDASILAVPSASALSVVASLTTIPSRIRTTCRSAIDSLLEQVDHIFLSVSKTYRRWPEPVLIPSYLFEAPYKDHVTVVLCEDRGSISKVLGPRGRLDPKQWAFVCDDDQVYQPGLVKAMMAKVEALCAYQNRCDTIRQNTSGGLIHGYVGYLIQPSWFDDLDPAEEGFRIDDQTLSAHLHHKNIPIRPTGLEAYDQLFAILDQGHERIGADALGHLGVRDQDVRRLAETLRVRFLRNGEVVRFLCRAPGARQGTYTYPPLSGYEPTSPSFLTYKGVPLLSIRYVNYRLTAKGLYSIEDEKGHLRTQNVLALLADSLTKIESAAPLVTRTFLSQTCVGIHGLEDVRLYEDGSGALRFLATQREWSSTRQNRIVRGDLVGSCLTNLEVLEPPTPTHCEKNWIPFGSDFIYGFHPLQLGSVSNGVLSIHTEWATPVGWEGLRGSTVPFEYQGAQWLVVHTSDETVPRHYRHRLVVLETGSGTPLQQSSSFVFGRDGIEFCIGFTIKDGAAWFWYSQHDCDPVWLTLPMDRVVGWMSPLENTNRV